MQYMFQMQLCFWQWLKKGFYWVRGDTEEKECTRDAIHVLIESLHKFWLRLKSQGWDKPKMHELLHIPDDIKQHGVPGNTNTSRTENHHISGVKHPFQHMQKQREMLDQQIACRQNEEHDNSTSYFTDSQISSFKVVENPIFIEFDILF